MQASHNKKKPAQERPDLDGRYGKIGISAVVAALPYLSQARNPAYAPAEPQPAETREEEEVAI